ncbi:hypothetical protein QR721_06470 [Aciduricibacillus chroicocephali]|uniref:Uncharacterized protein n=1 Tax=Aciduricibacillus chroicocephali TaxID=3054939 RepID=A0ABY9KYA3_9BACI|nr:hypothetical protein QR721_06470 [Bacillaceae bacterium 44XB]
MKELFSSKDFSSEIESSKELITIVQPDVNFTLPIFIGVLGIAVEIAGVARSFYSSKNMG